MSLLVLLAASPAHAAEAGALDGRTLGLLWGVPFAGMLLSIAIGPVAARHFWHHHYGKVAGFWALATIVPLFATFGGGMTAHVVAHAVLLEYIPFVVLLLALFTVAGDIRLTGTLVGTPRVNALLLLIGTVLAGWMGTTGAAMLLIRPLLRANEHRQYRAHTVVFFIFLVANIGGSATPLGDPPLFLGFLNGVDFFWTLHALLPETIFLTVVLLALYLVIDTIAWRREEMPPQEGLATPLRIEGWVQFPLLAIVIGAVLMSGFWKPGPIFAIAGVEVEGQNLARDLILLAVTGLSLALGSREGRVANGFSWEPIVEVAKLFIGIFISIAPVIAILRAGEEGALAFVVAPLFDASGAPVNPMFFWATGLLSGFLDNAPTYLVFFQVAGGDAQHLMNAGAMTLTAVSAGSVFMGALSYIGNAPNFMVRSIALQAQVRVPSFFGYMGWSFGILIPLYALLTWIFYL
jgi:Na+/H+ antiporter NhaD/arsenite permease-like protein